MKFKIHLNNPKEEGEHKNKNQKTNNKQTNNKMADVNTTISIITFNFNRLTISKAKFIKMNGKIKAQLYAFHKRHMLNIKTKMD